jgi:hypothetical protein
VTRTLLFCLLACAALSGRAQEIDLEWIDWERVDAGEIVYRTTPDGRGTVTMNVAVEIDAPREFIWDVLTACEVSPEYVPNVRECRLIGTLRNGAAELFEQVVKPAFFLPKFDHVFRLDYYPPDRIDVSHVSGPMDRMEGGWQMIERPGGIALVHQITIKPGFPVPRMFVRNTLESDLPPVLGEIRDRAEAAAAEAR